MFYIALTLFDFYNPSYISSNFHVFQFRPFFSVPFYNNFSINERHNENKGINAFLKKQLQVKETHYNTVG